MYDHRDDDQRYYDNEYGDREYREHPEYDRGYYDREYSDHGYYDREYYDSGYNDRGYDDLGRNYRGYYDPDHDYYEYRDPEYDDYTFDIYEPVPEKKKSHAFRNLIIIILIISVLCFLFPSGKGIADSIISLITHDDFATEEADTDAYDPGEFKGGADPAQQTPDPSGIDEVQSIPFYNIRYELLQLDEPLLKNFCVMYNAIAGFEDSCRFPYDMTSDDINLLCELINSECPELFQLDPYKVSYKTGILTGNVVSVNFKYSMTKEEYDSYNQQCLDIIWKIMVSAEGMNDYEKEICAYKYIIENCIYDDAAPNSGNVVGTLIDGRAKCEGISKAMKWILEYLNIMCLCPFGDSVDGDSGHMWNIVRLNGSFYDVDVTADTCKPDENRVPLYGAVNVSDTWIRSRYDMNGYAARRMTIPGYSGMDQSFHALNGRFVYSGGSYETVLYRLMHDVYTQGGGSFFIQFEDPDAFNEFITAADSPERIVSWFNSAGCRSRGFHSQMNYSTTYNICRLDFSFT